MKEVSALKIEIYQLKSSANSSVISNQHIQAEATELRQVIHCLRNEISSFQEILDKIRGQNPVSVISEQVSQKQITQPTNSKLHIASTSIPTLAQQQELNSKILLPSQHKTQLHQDVFKQIKNGKAQKKTQIMKQRKLKCQSTTLKNFLLCQSHFKKKRQLHQQEMPPQLHCNEVGPLQPQAFLFQTQKFSRRKTRGIKYHK